MGFDPRHGQAALGKQLLARIRADPTPLRMTYSTN